MDDVRAERGAGPSFDCADDGFAGGIDHGGPVFGADAGIDSHVV